MRPVAAGQSTSAERSLAGAGRLPLHSHLLPGLPLSAATGTEIVPDKIGNYRVSPNTMASIQVLSDHPEVAETFPLAEHNCPPPGSSFLIRGFLPP